MGLFSGIFGGKRIELGARLETLANLRLQVFRENYFGIKSLDRSKMPVRPLAPGLVQAIVEDVGAAERIVGWDRMRHLGKSDDQLFELAREQSEPGDQIAQSEIQTVQLFACNGFFLGGCLLRKFAGAGYEKGVLVAPISQHYWGVHVVQKYFTVPEIIPMMAMIASDLASKMQATDAERLVTDVYWLNPGGGAERIQLDGDVPVLSRALAEALA